jgi:hypothetical protein
MATPEYPDRDEWPRYWDTIRAAVVWLLVAVVIVGGGALLPRPDGRMPQIAADVLIGILVLVVATFVATRVNAWWKERRT